MASESTHNEPNKGQATSSNSSGEDPSSQRGGGLFRGDKGEVQGYDFSEFSADAEHDRLQKDFQDFLVAKHISGKSQVPDGHVIQSERTVDTGEKVEIGTLDSLDTSKPGITDERGHAEQVVVRRDDQGNIESIELHCSCGKITRVQFVEEDSDSANELSARPVEDLEDFPESEFRTMEFDGKVPEPEPDELNLNTKKTPEAPPNTNLDDSSEPSSDDD